MTLGMCFEVDACECECHGQVMVMMAAHQGGSADPLLLQPTSSETLEGRSATFDVQGLGLCFPVFTFLGAILIFPDLNCYTISCYVSKIKKFVPSREVPPLGGLFFFFFDVIFDFFVFFLFFDFSRFFFHVFFLFFVVACVSFHFLLFFFLRYIRAGRA